MQAPKEADGTGKLFRAGRRGLIDDVYGIVLLVLVLVLVQTRAPYLRRREAQLISRGERIGQPANAGAISWVSSAFAHPISQRPPADHKLLPKKCWHAGLQQGSMKNFSRDGTRVVPNDDWTLSDRAGCF